MQVRLVHRLREVGGDADARGLGAVAALAERGQQHEPHGLEPGVALDLAGERQPVHAGHLHVEDREVERAAGARRLAQLVERARARSRPSLTRMPQCRSCCFRISRFVALSSTTSTRRPARGAPAARAARLDPGLPRERHVTRKVLPRPGALVEPDLAAHQRHQALRDREPQPRPAVAPAGGAVGLDEGLEQARLQRRLDADAGVAHLELHDARSAALDSSSVTRSTTSPCSVNLTALPTRFVSTWRSRPGSPRSGLGTSWRIRHSSSRPLACAASANELEHLAHRLAQVEVRHLQVELARLDLREVEDVVDDVEQRAARLVDDAPRTRAGRRSAACRAAAASCRSRRSSACGSRGSCWPRTRT